MSNTRLPRRYRFFLTALATALVLATLLAGCGAGATKSTACAGNNFEEVTLQPGCSTICMAEPCAVYFRMPPGDGSFLVRGYGVDIGTYPAGQTAFLGSFFTGGHTFVVEGANVPPAHLTVLGRAQ
jgi:hypothetical protein